MQINYNDPYELPQEIVIPDGDPDTLREVLDFLNENARLIRNAERRERYHAVYHFEAMDYENSSVVYYDTPEHIVIRNEEMMRVNETIALLTETQLRRLTMQVDGFTLREIAETEGIAVNAVKESLDAAKKKFQKFF
ncbi:MAG: hypothetical protein K5756_05065 [Clostridiales bacterium]|nr:hypothetical protein [Clostridiales bacterium]